MDSEKIAMHENEPETKITFSKWKTIHSVDPSGDRKHPEELRLELLSPKIPGHADHDLKWPRLVKVFVGDKMLTDFWIWEDGALIVPLFTARAIARLDPAFRRAELEIKFVQKSIYPASGKVQPLFYGRLVTIIDDRLCNPENEIIQEYGVVLHQSERALGVTNPRTLAVLKLLDDVYKD